MVDRLAAHDSIQAATTDRKGPLTCGFAQSVRRPTRFLHRPEPALVGAVRQGADMKSRTAGMWWGTAIEAPDPGALARFYSDLLGWPIGHEEPGTAIVAAAQEGPYLVFQEAEGYQPPVWPPEPEAQ